MNAEYRLRCSLIVLNYEGADVIRPCLESLLVSMDPGLDELIVVDNASADESADIVAAEFPTVKLIRRVENNYIFGLNDGVLCSNGKYVVFLNNDIFVEREFVTEALKAFTDESIFAVCPRILQLHGEDQGSLTRGYLSRGLLFYEILPHQNIPSETFFAVGGQSFFRHDYLEEIGSIDPLLAPMYHEDIELSYRAWKRGWRIAYAPEARVWHIGSHSSKKVFTSGQLRSFVRQNELLIAWKNFTDPGLMARHAAALPARLVVAMLKRDWPTLVGFGRAISRLPDVRRARRAARATAALTDREVLNRVSAIGMARTDASSSAIRQRRLYEEAWTRARPAPTSTDLVRHDVWKRFVRPGQIVLDVGAGDGVLGRALMHDGLFISVEPSAAGASACQEPTVRATADALALRGESIDVAILSEVLEHVPEPAAALEELHRILKPGGSLLLSTPLFPLSPVERFLRRRQIEEEPTLQNLERWDPEHERRFTRTALVQLVERAGFTIDEEVPLFGSATSAAVYFIEPRLARLFSRSFAVAPHLAFVDRLLHLVEPSSSIAIVATRRTTSVSSR